MTCLPYYGKHLPTLVALITLYLIIIKLALVVEQCYSPIVIEEQLHSTWSSQNDVKHFKNKQRRTMRKEVVKRKIKEELEDTKTFKNYTTDFPEKRIREAKLWGRKFIQQLKLTKKLDLNTITRNTEIMPDFIEELEVKIKDMFIWALGEAAVTEVTNTVRENDYNKVDTNQQYSVQTSFHNRKEQIPWQR